MSLMPRDNTPDRLREAEAARAVRTAEVAAAEEDQHVEPAVPELLRARFTGIGLVVLATASLAAAADLLRTGTAAGLLAAAVVAAPYVLRGTRTFVMGSGPPPLPAAPTATGALSEDAPPVPRTAGARLRDGAGFALFLAVLAAPLVIIDGWHWTRLAVIPLGEVVGQLVTALLAAVWERRHPEQQLVVVGDPEEARRPVHRRPRPGYTPPREPFSVAGLPPA